MVKTRRSRFNISMKKNNRSFPLKKKCKRSWQPSFRPSKTNGYSVWAYEEEEEEEGKIFIFYHNEKIIGDCKVSLRNSEWFIEENSKIDNHQQQNCIKINDGDYVCCEESKFYFDGEGNFYY